MKRHGDEWISIREHPFFKFHKKMSNYSFSEEGSEAAADEELLRDLDNLREVLEEDDSAGKTRFCVTSGLVARRALNGRHMISVNPLVVWVLFGHCEKSEKTCFPPAAREEEGNALGSLAERPLEGLKLCLQKNH